MFIIKKQRNFRNRHRINDQIRVSEVRLIDEDGEPAGVVSKDQALEMAKAVGMDLVEVAANAAPPVCRIIDYGKFIYQQSKRAHEAKKKQKIIHLKEIKLSPNIDDHDLLIKMKHASEFLEHGDKLKITIKFRGREMRQTEKGWRIAERVTAELSEFGSVDAPPKKEGRNIYMIMTSRVKKKGT